MDNFEIIHKGGTLMNHKSAILMGVVLFVFSIQAWAGRPTPDTGQTKCYNADGVEISCTGTGQDAAYTINPMSFTKLDAAGRELPDDAAEWLMVRDNVTGLIWEVKQNKDEVEDYTNPHDADNTYTWYDPNLDSPADGKQGDCSTTFDTHQFITALNTANFGGYHDWRLPSREELRSIVDYSIPSPGPAIVVFNFPHCISSDYWSFNTDAYYLGSAWRVSFYNGYDYGNLKSDDWYVRAVRDGQ
jgi:hypothetical protein